MKYIKKLLVIFLVVSLVYYPVKAMQEQIRYAAILFRHGDRTPVDQYPLDPYSNESLWPVRFGELTNTGKQQHFALGKWFRQRYKNVVSAKFDPKEIYVRSTDVDRTLMSASVNLAGMYPPVADSVWNTHLQWQPIPIHTLPEYDDEILSMKKKCPNFDTESDRVKKSLPYINRLKKYKDLMKYLSENSGGNVTDYYHILNIYSVLRIEKLYNFTLPAWTSKVFPDKMREPACYSFTTETANPLMARLKVGPFLKEVVHNMDKVKRYHNSFVPSECGTYNKWVGEIPLKMHIYSAHDLNIGSVLNALGLYDGNCPEYTATIMFELVFDDSTQIHTVRIVYRNTTEIKQPVVLRIPRCSNPCPLEQFMKLYSYLLPNNWERECYHRYPTAAATAVFFSLALLLFTYGLYYGLTVWTTRRINKYYAVVPEAAMLEPAFTSRMPPTNA